jgi:hypothetical protein
VNIEEAMSGVQAVENWSDVEGTVKGLAPSASNSSLCLAKLHVDSVEAVPNFPNFVARKHGNEIAICIAKQAVETSGIKVGDRIRLRVQQTGLESFFGHPERIERLA